MAQYIRTGENNNYPITIDEAKSHLRVVGTFDDSDIGSIIAAATGTVENYTWRPLMEQTWKLYLDSSEVIEDIIINKAPLISIDLIQYYDATNTLETLSTDNYYTDIVGDPARIKITKMPQVYDRFNAMVITFKCGYAALSNEVTATSVSHAQDTITKANHGLVSGQMIIITQVQNITNITADTLYYVANAKQNTFQLSTVPFGSNINLGGSDTPAISYKSYGVIPKAIKSAMKLIIGHLFEHREDVVVGASVADLPMNSTYLLEPYVNKYIYR
jgi:uncharacterized phiE125 gp8 family phage protein